ncbi:MAG: glycosyltransferase family 39 protein [Planctomycetes bacterium]|nr:glycosyltransferase family 39 protein [Planctomycetota bacterium]
MLCGARALWEPDEGRYAEAAREMARSGDLVVPRLSGEPHLTKPPMTYWATCLGILLFGCNAFGARIALALAFVATSVCVRAIARAWDFGDASARAAQLIYLTSALPFAAGHILTSDTFLVFFQTFAVLAAHRAWAEERYAGRWRLAFWLALAAGMLTKGPVGLLPLAYVTAFTCVRRELRPLLHLWSPVPVALFVLGASSWYLVIAGIDPARFEAMVRREFIGHLSGTAGKAPEPVWIYAPILVVGALPWCAFWPRIARNVVGMARNRDRWSVGAVFCAVWLVVTILICALISARLPFYILPAFAPLALATAPSVARFLTQPCSSAVRNLTTFASAVWGGILLLFLVYPERAPRSGSYVALTTQIRRGEDGGAARLCSIGRMSMHSIEFMLDRAAVPIGESLRSALESLPVRDSDGSRPVLVLKKKHGARFTTDEFAVVRPKFEVLAEQRGVLAVRRLTD